MVTSASMPCGNAHRYGSDSTMFNERGNENQVMVEAQHRVS